MGRHPVSRPDMVCQALQYVPVRGGGGRGVADPPPHESMWVRGVEQNRPMLFWMRSGIPHGW